MNHRDESKNAITREEARAKKGRKTKEIVADLRRDIEADQRARKAYTEGLTSTTEEVVSGLRAKTG